MNGLDRTIVLSHRDVAGGAGQALAFAAWHEAEDVLVNTTTARVIPLDRHIEQPSVRARRLVGRVVRRVAGRAAVLPARARAAAAARPNHVIFMAHGPWDLPLLERLREVRNDATTISVWMPEVWPTDIEDSRIRFEAFHLVDQLFVGIDEVREQFRNLAPNADVHVLPPATDVVRFSPRSIDHPRGIAVLGIGRRDPDQHQWILRWANDRDRLYLYDTVVGTAADWRMHRDALAAWYRHAGTAICNAAKHDRPEVTDGLRVLPGRLYEGLAAGAILIGHSPDRDRQMEVLGCQVIQPVEGREESWRAALDDLDHPDRHRRRRLDNIALACRGHDWGHRWQHVLDVLDVEMPLALQDRLDLLEKRASDLESRFS